MLDRTRLTAAFAVTLTLCGCGLITPRDEGYFRTHADEARLVVTRCKRGQESGSDCKAAAQAVAALDRAAKNASAKERRQRALFEQAPREIARPIPKASILPLGGTPRRIAKGLDEPDGTGIIVVTQRPRPAGSNRSRRARPFTASSPVAQTPPSALTCITWITRPIPHKYPERFLTILREDALSIVRASGRQA